jgi:hypothetical protein
MSPDLPELFDRFWEEVYPNNYPLDGTQTQRQVEAEWMRRFAEWIEPRRPDLYPEVAEWARNTEALAAAPEN